MNIIYEGIDISTSVQPTTLQITDNAGGKPDSIRVVFSDTEGLWSKWGPKKNDTLQIIDGSFDSGIMYIDEIALFAGSIQIKALSIPQTAKTARSQGWSNVRLLEIATQIAIRHGFSLQTYNLTNHFYERVDQMEEADLFFLAYRCMMEGYALKINNNQLVIFNERAEEQKAVNQNAIIRSADMHGAFDFKTKSTDIYGKCIVKSHQIKGEFTDASIYGPTLKQNVYVSYQDEANRWAKGFLRSMNKFETFGSFSINLNTKFAAGIPIQIKDVGLFDGKYFVERLIHDLINNRTKLLVRKPLEGY